MNKVQMKRLLNVARALRDAHAAKKKFDMEKWIFGDVGALKDSYDPRTGFYKTCNEEANFCGTPACALGHYAARTDLQRLLKVSILKDRYGTKYATMDRFGGVAGDGDWEEQDVKDHFGIDGEEFSELFDPEGCNNARTSLQAAKYIEKFVKRKQNTGRSNQTY